jgi:putative ABC transport system substrate-binding protein
MMWQAAALLRGQLMRRREFITLLGGATTFSFAARAQHVPVRSIGFLHAGSPEPNANFVSEFRKGLGETDHVEGRDFSIEFRWAAGRDDRLPELAADLIDRKIAAPGSTQAALAAKVATSTIPIVFGVAADPVALGLVSSFSHPSGNATGIFFISPNLAANGSDCYASYCLTPRASPRSSTNTVR